MTALLRWPGHAWCAVPARWYIGAVFLLACLHKIADPGAFALDIATYDILPLALVNPMAIVLPYVELIAGLGLLLGFRTKAAALLTSGMMVVFLVALVIALLRGLDMSCGCFASQGAEGDPISWWTVARDLAWLALSAYVLFFDRARLGIEGRGGFMKRSAVVFLFLALAGSASAAPLPDACEALKGERKALALELLGSEHLYDCCDGTIAGCLKQEPACPLATRLAANVCRRVGAGEDAERIRRALSRRARSMLPGGAPVEIDLRGIPPAGTDEAPIELVVYACARCPFCSKLVPELYKAVNCEALRGKVRMYLRVYPIRDHPFSKEGGLAFLAAARQGKFWGFVLQAYSNFDRFKVEDLPAWAEAVGMKRDVFERDMADPALRDSLVESKKEGLRNGVEATPTVFIDRRRYVGDLTVDELVDVIGEESERQSQAGGGATRGRPSGKEVP